MTNDRRSTLLTGKPYTSSAATDLRKVFARERRRLKALADAQLAADQEAAAKTIPLRRKGGK